ncbi:hypothetical protein Bca52824_001072 [Brassica carinata]|uniref:Uncharacterized protein n=1 Tax=Brassica carinata TaxID=52824 RepID=A0A8X8BDH7_BRACI|nr:hypothetical protein Bca52824_001072 [Brassica carinata]
MSKERNAAAGEENSPIRFQGEPSFPSLCRDPLSPSSGGAEIGQGHGLAEKDNGDEDEEDEDEDLSLRFAPARHAPSSVSSTGSNNINRDSKPPAVSFALRNRSPSSALGRNFVEQVPSVRSASAGRPSISARSTAPTPNLMPPSTVKAPKAIPPLDPPTRSRDKSKLKRKKGDQREASALRDELDMLQEEYEIVLEKLRRAEEKKKQKQKLGLRSLKNRFWNQLS